ncbi:hypothetical protein V8C37DRAFT_405232 [Trichoderma ceciliae]
MLFGGIVMSRETVTISDILSAVYLTTTLTISDGTTTYTDTIKPSTSSSTALPPRPSPSASPSPSTFATSSISQSSSFTTQVITQATTPNLESQTSTTAAPTTAIIPIAKLAETAAPSPTAQSTPINAAQIAGIAIGSSAIIGVVASVFFIFFFFGRRNACPVHSNRRVSMHKVGAGLGSFKAKIGKLWKGSPKQQTRRSHGTTTSAGPAATTGAQKTVLPPERPVNNSPYFYHPVTTCVAGELESNSTVLHNPSSASRRQNQQDQILPIELPTSLDPGNSPLPKYEELDTARRYRMFSWAAPESAYRLDKFEPDNKI